jgi:ATP-dependent Clp protease ATP-binding subunit ClpA
MFERFTERARQVVVLAQDEARLLGHGYIGTEHLLLGLLRDEEGLAARVLDSFDVTVEEVRAQVARRTAHLQGDEDIVGEIPFTARAKKALELALREARSLGHEYIDTEHILLGLIRENEGVAARILLDFDADAGTIRNQVIRVLSGTRPLPTTEERMRRRAQQAARERGTPKVAQLVIDCPICATPIEAINTVLPNAGPNVSAAGDRTCPGCGKQWRIAYTVSWEEQSPEDDTAG